MPDDADDLGELMKVDVVRLTFDKILAGIEALEVQLAREAPAAYQENRYEDAEDLSDSIKGLKRFRNKFGTICSEWESQIESHVRKRVKIETRKPLQSETKGVLRNLRVTLPSGRVIQRPTSAITMAEAIEAMGIAKVNALGITICGAPLLSIEKHSNYGQTRIGKYYIYTQGNTTSKKHILEAIAARLGYEVKVDVF